MNIEISDLIKIITKNFRYFCYVFVVSALIIIPLALFMQNKYTSSASFSLSNSTGELDLPSSANRLASFAGLNLSNSNVGISSDEFIGIMTSHTFLSNFIEEHDLTITILAADIYDEENDKITIDQDIYDSENSLWKKKIRGKVPSTFDAVEELKDDMLYISYDEFTGIISLSVTSISPTFSHELLEKLVRDIDTYVRNIQENEANRAKEFLNEEVSKTSNVAFQSNFSKLIEENLKTIVLSNTKDYFLVDYIEKPVLPKYKSAPTRSLIVIGFVFFSLFITYLYCFYIYVNNNGAFLNSYLKNK